MISGGLDWAKNKSVPDMPDCIVQCVDADLKWRRLVEVLKSLAVVQIFRATDQEPVDMHAIAP